MILEEIQLYPIKIIAKYDFIKCQHIAGIIIFFRKSVYLFQFWQKMIGIYSG